MSFPNPFDFLLGNTKGVFFCTNILAGFGDVKLKKWQKAIIKRIMNIVYFYIFTLICSLNAMWLVCVRNRPTFKLFFTENSIEWLNDFCELITYLHWRVKYFLWIIWLSSRTNWGAFCIQRCGVTLLYFVEEIKELVKNVSWNSNNLFTLAMLVQQQNRQ